MLRGDGEGAFRPCETLGEEFWPRKPPVFLKPQQVTPPSLTSSFSVAPLCRLSAEVFMEPSPFPHCEPLQGITTYDSSLCAQHLARGLEHKGCSVNICK